MNLDDPFDVFWSKFPRHEGKKAARRVFSKLKPEDKLLAIKDCESRYIGIEKQYIPHPATYLNGERWEDDPIPRPEKKEDLSAKRTHASQKLWKP